MILIQMRLIQRSRDFELFGLSRAVKRNKKSTLMKRVSKSTNLARFVLYCVG